jgi:hypothetical protein
MCCFCFSNVFLRVFVVLFRPRKQVFDIDQLIPAYAPMVNAGRMEIFEVNVTLVRVGASAVRSFRRL